MRGWRAFLFRVGLLVGAVLPAMAVAAPPENADPSLAPWFNDLRTPWTNARCCSIADCRTVSARVVDDHYEVFVGGMWRSVPPTAVLQRRDNPTGQPVACWTPQGGITCFVRAPGL